MSALLARDYWHNPAPPRIVLLPVGLMGVVLLQWLLGKIVYFDQAMLYVLYLLFAMLLILLGARLRDELGLPRLAQMLAIALLVGAELSALVGVLQHFAWHTPLDALVAAKISAAVYGNLAQPNHFAAYIALGLIALGLLFQQGRFKLRWVVLLALPLLLVMTLSASRSSWLYFLLMLGMAWRWTQRDSATKLLLHYCLWLLIGFGLMHWVAHLQVMNTQTSIVDTVQRLRGGNETGDIRLYLWHEAWLMLWQSLWLGVGFGQFAWQHFQLVPQLQPGNILGLYNNAHNLVLQLAAETGLAGLLAVFFTLTVWLRGVWRATHHAAHWWGYAALGVLGIHSLLEYPLWYLYFISIAALLLGMFDENRYALKLRLVGRVSVTSALLLGLVLLLQLQSGYRELEQTLASSTSQARFDRQAWQQLRRVPLLSPYADLLAGDYIEVDKSYLGQKLALNTRLVRFAPVGVVVYRQALLLAQNGQIEQAMVMWNQARWSYPNDALVQRNRLVGLARNDPAHFAALLEFALQKEQEFQGAVHHR